MGTYLGQNFLMNKSKLRKIVDALELKKGDTVIEIGPGHGELTGEIIARLKNCKIKKLILIEKDEKFAEILKNLRGTKWKQNKNAIEIITGDILKILPALNTKYKIQNTKYKLVGNIPYYITGYLLRVISELKFKPETVILTIQKEVAQRICALRQAQGKPKAQDKPNMNLLAASVQFWAEPKIIGYISKKDFRPIPKVDSAIIKLVIRQLSNYEITQLLNYYRFIKILFKQPRKTILNNLKSLPCRQAGQISNLKNDEFLKKIAKAGVNPSDRPQNLNLEQIKNLSI